MNFFMRASNGWNIAANSLKIMKANRKMFVFPLLSGFSLLFIFGYFIFLILHSANWNMENVCITGIPFGYGGLFLFYLANYFVIVFFNTGLTYCTALYFKGEKVSVKKGLLFSCKRVGAVLSWSLYTATIGSIVRVIPGNSSVAGTFPARLSGAIFGLAAYFVVPVITNRHLGTASAFKHSKFLVKKHWGETAGAAFSFNFVQFITVIFIAIGALTIGTVFTVGAGITLAIMAILVMITVVSAIKSVFISTVFHYISGNRIDYFDQPYIDSLFRL